MVERHIAGRGLADPRLLAAFRAVPREAFVADDMADFAYQDGPLPIAADQTISQPYIVALMVDAAGVASGARVLEIGAGSGYAAAILGQLAGEVVAIERHEELARLASERMKRLGYDNVRVIHGDGTHGWPAQAPYDAVLVSASGSHVPDVLRRQLKVGATLVLPVGEPHAVQRLVKVTRIGEDAWQEEDLGRVRFVPLIGAHGWG